MASETSDETAVPGLGDRLRVGEVGTLVAPTVAWFTAFLLVPLAIIAVYSVLTYESFSVVWEFSPAAWQSVLEPTVYSTFVRTLVIGVGVTVLCLLFGYPLAYYLRFYTSETGGTLLLLFLVIPFWTSALIRTIGWYPILGRTGVVNKLLVWSGVVGDPVGWLMFSPFSQVVGYVAAYVVFMAAPIFVSLSQIDEDLLDASETLRGGPAATFRHVTLPLSLPGVAIGVIFVFVLSIGDFMVPQFLSGGESTVTTLIYLSVNNGLNYPDASALSIALLLVIFVVVYALTRLVDISEITQG